MVLVLSTETVDNYVDKQWPRFVNADDSTADVKMLTF